MECFRLFVILSDFSHVSDILTSLPVIQVYFFEDVSGDLLFSRISNLDFVEMPLVIFIVLVYGLVLKNVSYNLMCFFDSLNYVFVMSEVCCYFCGSIV